MITFIQVLWFCPQSDTQGVRENIGREEGTRGYRPPGNHQGDHYHATM